MFQLSFFLQLEWLWLVAQIHELHQAERRLEAQYRDTGEAAEVETVSHITIITHARWG